MTVRSDRIEARDKRSIQDSFNRSAADIRALEEGDIVVESPRRLFIRDTDGIYWKVEVSTAGVLTTTSVGATLP